MIVKPIYALGDFFKAVVEVAIAAIVFGTGKVANLLSEQGRTLQNGSVGLYLFVFVLGFSTIVYYLFLA
jgi:NADH-quinone oxidoreductase subunit L